MIGVFGVWAATRPYKGRLAPRSQRVKVVLVGVAMTTLAFFVAQIPRQPRVQPRRHGQFIRQWLLGGHCDALHRHRHALRGDPPAALQSPPRRVLSPSADDLRAQGHPGRQGPPSYVVAHPGGDCPRDRGSGSLVSRGGRQLWPDRAARLRRDPGVGRLTFGHRRLATHGDRRDGSSHRSGARIGAQPLAHVLRSVRVRGDSPSHSDDQPVETKARSPRVFRGAGARLK